MPKGPLAGIRVLEFSQIVAGPVAGIALSDFGADVVKVEPPGGEARRNAAAVVPNEGKYFQSLNRGKRSLVIDMAHPTARQVIHRLIPGFDVVVINYRNGVAERLGIDYATLSAINPRLVYANITGFGDTGPNATRAGSDIVAQAYSGVMAAEAKTDEYGAPAPVTASTFIDRSSGLAAAMGICAALFDRERTGLGQEIHVSLIHTALELLSNQVMREPLHDAVVRDPLLERFAETRASGAPYDAIAAIRKSQGPRFASHRLYYGGYHTKEGGLVLGALTQQNRDTIRGILDMHDPTDSPDFNAAEPGNRELMETWRGEIQKKLMARPATEWVELLVAAGVPASVVNLPEEMSDDPHVIATGIMVDLEHPMTGPQRVVGPIVRMSRTPTAITRPSPPLAAHSAEVLKEHGFTPEEIVDLVRSSVLRQSE